MDAMVRDSALVAAAVLFVFLYIRFHVGRWAREVAE
jgi:hypothetical protein